jgi:hypothetical protein
MKKILPILLIVAVVVILMLSMSNKDTKLATIKGNSDKKIIKITPDKYVDTKCAMTIKSENHACEAISPDGETWFFDDIGCLVLWLKDREFKDDATLYTHAEDSGNWIDAREAWYVRDDHTPMHYGFGAREHKKEGMIDFESMQLMMLRGENMTNPKIRKKLLGL